MAEVSQICVDPISCHAYSSNFDKLAFSPNNNEVHIYSKSTQQQQTTTNTNDDSASNSLGWSEEHVLKQHDMRVTSIDWAPKTNRIVTCSADRNAYVWVKDESNQIWKPALVLLRINRAATCVKWSPYEDKFAVATSAKLVCVCYFESCNDWWLSKHIKKPIKSTVTSLDWHPDNILLACGSTDYKARIFSTFIKDVDKACESDSSWLKLKENNESITATGTLVSEFSTSSAWVHDVAFSPDGLKLAWVSHDSTISIVDSTVRLAIITVKTRYLPFLSCLWASNRRIVAAGHDCCPMFFGYETICNNLTQNGDDNGAANVKQVLKFIGRLDRPQKKDPDLTSAMKKFKDLAMKGNTNSNVDEFGNESDSLSTIHQNTIGQIRRFCHGMQVERLSTVGVDGKLVVWTLDTSVL